MNSSLFLRFVNKTIKNPGCSFSRLFNTANIKRMTTNISITEMKKERDTFSDVLPYITESLQKSPKFAEVPEVGIWVRKVLEYNLTGGKKARGLNTVLAYEMLEKPENITEESLKLARIVGWCVEMLQAYLLVLDDMMDGSTMRRGVTCWYRLPDVGLGAINDSILIYTSMIHTLKANIGDKKYFTDVLELFNDTLLNTSIGQHLDYTMAHRNKNDYSLFTIDRYNAIVKFKTSHYTFKLPICLGLYLANKNDKDIHKIAENIFLELGQLFQMQDDFLDCYGDESISGKNGTDIQEGKCTWFAVTALQRCTPAQRAVFEACYGSKDPADVQRVKRLYDDLELHRLYTERESAIYEHIVKKTHELPPTRTGDVLSPALVMRLLDMIYKRKH